VGRFTYHLFSPKYRKVKEGENERSEPGRLKNGGVENEKWKFNILISNWN